VLFNPEHQTDPASLAASFTVVLLPYSLVGPFAGVLLDRWRRQRVLAVGNLARAVVVCVTAALIATLGPTSVPFYVAALVAISVNRFYLAALSAALPHVVAERDLVMANSVSTTSGTLATIVGGGLALALRAVVGSGDAGSALIALLAAGGYVASSAVAAGFAADLLGPTERPPAVPLRSEVATVARGLAAGARHVWARQRARDALAAIASHRFFYGISTIATILLYRNHFRDHGVLRAGLPGLAEIFAAGALGVLAAAVVTPVATRRLAKETWIALTLAGAAVIEVALGLPYLQATFVPAAALLGFVAQASKICVDTIVQETVADDFLGRVFASYDMLFNVTFVVAALASAAWLPVNGLSYPAVVVIAVGYAATAAAYARASFRRHAGLTPAQRAAELTPAG
jgi:MFS family permease